MRWARISALSIPIRKNPPRTKIYRKCTYPPPADGPCVLFLCKSGCSANVSAAQVGRGALQRFGNFTECKVLKENAALLYSSTRGGHGRGKAGVPGFIGREFVKHGIRCFFKNAHDLFWQRLAVYGKMLNPYKPGTTGLQVFFVISISVIVSFNA